MADEKKLTGEQTVAKEYEKMEALAAARAALTALDVRDVEKATETIRFVREVFPEINHILTPAEIVQGIFGDIAGGLDKVAACPQCLSCFTCQNCNSCQTCNYCQSCESCNTCQKQAAGVEVINPEDILRLQVVNALKILSRKIVL